MLEVKSRPRHRICGTPDTRTIQLSLGRMFIVGLTTLVIVVGCGEKQAPNTVAPSRSTSTSLPSGAVESIAQAQAFRTSVGLRADEAWIREVTANPAAVYGYGDEVALTVEEQADLDSRVFAANELASVVNDYARGRADFGGILIDQKQGGLVVVRFTDHLEQHRRALGALVRPGARLQILQVEHSWDDLIGLSRRVGLGRDWALTVEAVIKSSGVDIVRNMVKVSVSSANDAAPAAIVAHFEGEGRMFVETDGTGVELWPTGTLVVKAVDSQGRPVPGLRVLYTGDVEGTGGDDVGFSTNADGELEVVVTAVGYTVTLVGSSEGPVGQGHVVVPPDGIATILIEVD